jgi:ATPase subunit of ABC transporter with duplicated ATPase domains
MINGYNVCLEMVEQVIFDDISFVFDHDQRIGLVGRNGSGKSTLLKVIAGKQQLDKGTVSIQKCKTIAYLSQDVVLQSDKSIVEETYTSFAHVAGLLEEQKAIEAQLDNADDLDELLERYATVCEKLLDVDQESMRRGKKVLMGRLNQSSLMSCGNVECWLKMYCASKLLLQKLTLSV